MKREQHTMKIKKLFRSTNPSGSRSSCYHDTVQVLNNLQDLSISPPVCSLCLLPCDSVVTQTDTARSYIERWGKTCNWWYS